MFCPQPVRRKPYASSMSDKSEKLALRLGDILTRLFMGEVLSPEQLVADYQVSEKTLRRDFNERLVNAPIIRTNEGYRLDPIIRSQGNLNINKVLYDIGLSELLPKHYKLNGHAPVLFKNPRSERTDKFDALFKQLTEVIAAQVVIDLNYNEKPFESVHPYRLVNDRGLWYLAATYCDQLHSYRLRNISQIHLREDKYKPSQKIYEEIHRQGMEWLTPDNAEVLVQVDRDVAPRFLERTILPHQQLLKELSDGSLLVSSRVSRLSDILPLLKSWIPQVEVLSPVSLKLELIRDLHATLDRYK
ncbi:helix-turn-helix transcriptional regulator [Vibrio vulnificus]|uniref:helix-turn-helix transcriptional regulator n=1 Tax=Vibrio vulnificus TaxID=672 RepID=UPI001CDD1976|nr:WYL domain-containing transcriptional regulator [Vibrio vulnificus]MCA3928072.1 WYL domain-containing transcriptional regulator [Vibrio vulnificus]